VLGPQLPVPTHVWPMQLSPNTAQFWQTEPPVPQRLTLVPLMHVLPWQQPVGHVWGLQIDWITHDWFWHVPPNTEQFWHWLPPAPHAVLEPPATQLLPWQQPNGHVCALHTPTPTQVWPWQLSPMAAQFWHWLPAKPQAVGSTPGVHTLPWQHPGQLAWLQSGGPLTH